MMYECEQPWFSALNAVREKAQVLMSDDYSFSIGNDTLI